MKKIILLLLLSVSLFSNDYELRLYEKVMYTLFSKNTIKVYTNDKTRSMIKNSKMFKLTRSCHDADIVIGKNFTIPELCTNKPIFATDYRTFRRYKNSIGAFYWKKGRPQLKFDVKKMKKFNFHLPDSLKKYAE